MVIETHSADETREAGVKISKKLKPGDVIALDGPLGAGKTTLVQGIAKGLNVPGNVASPTFTLINEYKGILPLFHIDLFRLEDSNQIDEIGLFDYFKKGGVCVIEWAERLGNAVPPNSLEVAIELLGEKNRRIITNFEV
jgi:tRNA threonylcarbamoyladenosine biosynthesis protein TsaE